MYYYFGPTIIKKIVRVNRSKDGKITLPFIKPRTD